MTDEQKREILAGFLERAQIAEKEGLPATAKSWRDRHNNLMLANTGNLILAKGAPAMGINRSDVFPSKYIASADIDGREISLIIQDIQIEDLSDGERKAVLYFTKGTKGMVLNVTNWTVLEDAYGMDTDSWIGKPIILYVERTTYKGKPTKGLRLRAPPVAKPALKVANAPQQAPVQESEYPGDPSDEIPF